MTSRGYQSLGGSIHTTFQNHRPGRDLDKERVGCLGLADTLF